MHWKVANLFVQTLSLHINHCSILFQQNWSFVEVKLQTTHNLRPWSMNDAMFLLRAYCVLPTSGLIIQQHKWSRKHSDNITYYRNFYSALSVRSSSWMITIYHCKYDTMFHIVFLEKYRGHLSAMTHGKKPLRERTWSLRWDIGKLRVRGFPKHPLAHAGMYSIDARNFKSSLP